MLEAGQCQFLCLLFAAKQCTFRMVDLISYTVESLSPPVVYESATSSGGFCGSSFLNEKFSEYLDARLRDFSGWNQEAQSLALGCFERDIKPKFFGSDEVFWIHLDGLPGSLRREIEKNRVAIPGKDLREKVFEPVINEVLTLVRNQIRKTQSEVKAILVVGGFGQNMYLKEMLRGAVRRNVQVHFLANRYIYAFTQSYEETLQLTTYATATPLFCMAH
jgi:hypothetical protein